MKSLLPINLALLVVLGVIAGLAKIGGVAPEVARFEALGLHGASLVAFGVAQVGAAVLLTTLPSRRIGAGLALPMLLIEGYAWLALQPTLAAPLAVLLAAMTALVFATTPRDAMPLPVAGAAGAGVRHPPPTTVPSHH